MRRRALGAVARLSMALAVVSLVGLVLVVTASIVLRLAGSSLPSSDDIASILLAGTMTLGFAAAVAGREHIRVGFFVDALAERPRRFVVLATELLTVAVVGLLAAGLARIWLTALESGAMTLGAIAIPRALPIGIVAFGVLLFEIALLLHVAGSLAGAGRREG